MGGIKKYLLFDFVKYCYFSRGLHNGCRLQDYIFLRRNEGICQKVVGEEETYQN